MTYVPDENRYKQMIYNRLGRSGVLVSALSLGLWHNFGEETPEATARATKVLWAPFFASTGHA